jgi:uncharacterized protein YjbJ (UPF0337 family)
MDKDRVKGKANEVVGRAKRQAGEWTGDTQTQAEGAGQEIKGHVQTVVGKVKDAVKDATADAKRPVHSQHDDAEETRTGSDRLK